MENSKEGYSRIDYVPKKEKVKFKNNDFLNDLSSMVKNVSASRKSYKKILMDNEKTKR